MRKKRSKIQRVVMAVVGLITVFSMVFAFSFAGAF